MEHITEDRIKVIVSESSDALFKRFVDHGEKNWVSQLQCEKRRNKIKWEFGIAMVVGALVLVAFVPGVAEKLIGIIK